MTEDDVTTMAASVLATPLDPAAEQTWARAVTTELLAREQRLMAEWRMWQYVRSDAKMQSIATELDELRSCLQHAARVLGATPGVLDAANPSSVD